MSLAGDRLPGSGLFSRRINRAPSRILATIVPWISVALLSLVPLSPIIASAPVVPPLAFMLLVSWQLLRPGLLPVWAGFPLGLIDDLYSGQPFGSAMFLWSVTMIVMDMVDDWARWRGFWQDWMVASLAFASYLALAMAIAALAGGPFDLSLIVPQLLLSLIMFPLFTRIVAVLDMLRRARVKVVG
ncbi:rod shape-determining protein MreD [Croceicoccus hydrothermalis]|uniref:rod shape-determining protein MreD n=1 Tax=Croceicoccus hydrothermalis TaxID=2867964 RepID=UPI001EFB8178|nr:rod shape-determining protein MreD [Croceicoccus hydrothermalis]